MKRLFHYTRLSNLQKIKTAGKINQATNFVEPPEMPVVWFSYRQDWEPTATPYLLDKVSGKFQRLTFEEFVRVDIPARIEVAPSTAPLDWRTWRETSGVKPKSIKYFKGQALRLNAALDDWRMSYEPVTHDNWLAIELFVNGQWCEEAKLPTTNDFGEYLKSLGYAGASDEAVYWADCQKNLEKMRAAYLRDGNYGRYLSTFNEHEQLRPFLDIIPRLSAQEYWQLLREVWIDVEVMLPNKEIWLELLQWQSPGREHLMTDAERAELAAMPDTIEIWRGCGDRSAVRGFSWTIDRERAVFFADYASGPRRQWLGQSGTKRLLVKATCRKKDVLAYFTTRNESEIVVNPDHVTVLRVSRAPAPKPKDPMKIKRELEKMAAEIRALFDQPQTVPAE